MKQFVALARVSSRQQEREGFSLEVQEDALKRYATQAGGEIVKLLRIAETASKTDERKTFRELALQRSGSPMDLRRRGCISKPGVRGAASYPRSATRNKRVSCTPKGYDRVAGSAA